MNIKFDKINNDIIVYEGDVVMTRGEEPYFDKLFFSLRNLRPRNVLEIGYGLGISASLIQKHLKPSSHLIIEIDDNIGVHAKKFSNAHSGVEVLIDDWFNIEYKRKFDFIFFDTFDYSEYENASKKNVSNKLSKLLNENGVLSHPHFGDGDISLYPDFKNYVIERFKINSFMAGDGIICDDVASIVCCRNEDDMDKIISNL